MINPSKLTITSRLVFDKLCILLCKKLTKGEQIALELQKYLFYRLFVKGKQDETSYMG